MANATKYVDNVNGSDSNDGDSEPQAYLTIPHAISQITGGGNTIYVQAGSNYVITTAITVTAALVGDLTDGRNRIEGYTTTPGARDGRPTITCATNSITIFQLNNNDYWEFIHLKITHTAATRGVAFNTATSDSTPLFFGDLIIDGVSAVNLTRLGAYIFEGCEIKNCTSATGTIIANGATGILVQLWGCDIHDNAGPAVVMTNSQGLDADGTIFDTNGGAAAINVVTTNGTARVRCSSCTFVDNTGDGIQISATTATAPAVTLELHNNIFYGNGGYGLDNQDELAACDAATTINRRNAFGAQGVGNLNGLSSGYEEIALTADPFIDRANRNFAPNNVAGGGVLLQATAFPTNYPGGTSMSQKDVGAVQHCVLSEAQYMIGI